MKATMTVKAGIETFNISFNKELGKWSFECCGYGFTHEKLSYILLYIEEKTGYTI